jgi:hypothetical protein
MYFPPIGVSGEIRPLQPLDRDEPETPVTAKLSAEFSDGIGLFRTIKKPACGRLLGDWLGLFLVSLASLQNVHPDLRPAVGLGQTLVCRVGRSLSRGAGRCANVGRRILSFAWDSQPEVRVKATSAPQIRNLYRLSGPLREQARSHRVQCRLEKNASGQRNGTTGRRLLTVDHQNTQPNI